ncbi:MAG: hypothetical protein K2Z81_10165 [Cyanobacteria bacterium]|nr:hypothetical protein [Cyanobacteriota bacterium]
MQLTLWGNTMNRLQSVAFALSIAFLTLAPTSAGAQTGNPGANVSMTIYPVVRNADGNQYLITPSGKQVTIPGLGIAPDATQVPVYRDSANHFWYTNMNGQQVAVTPNQLEAAQAQISGQSGNAGMPPPMMPGAQSYYASTPAFAGGFNGIPYGTPITMDGPGQYSYMGSGGKQYVVPNPEINGHLNQWQQQVPFGQQPNFGGMQSAQQMPPHMQNGSQQMQGMPPQMQGGSQQPMQGSASTHGMGLIEMRRERRAERLESRSQNQADNARKDQEYADQKMESGTLGTGMSARRAAREERRSKREEKRAEHLQGN